jgi:hypothetical protein
MKRLIISSEDNQAAHYFFRKNEVPHDFIRKNQAPHYFFRTK